MRLGAKTLPIETLSATSLSKAVSCPEAWRRRYLLHEREGFGVDKFVGTVDHETVAAYMTDKMNTGVTWDESSLSSAYTYCWSDQLEKSEADGEKPAWGAQSPSKLAEHGQLMVKTYVEKAADTVAPVAVEQLFEQTLPGVPVPLIGYIDIETKDKIVERKTSKTRVNVPRPGWRFQARLYQLAQPRPVEWHITTRQVQPQVQTGMTLPLVNPDTTVVQVQELYWILDGYYQRYGPNSPWPTLGIHHDWLCSKCGFGPNGNQTCIAWRNQ